MGIASLILGIVAILLASTSFVFLFFTSIIAVVIAILGILFGGIAISKGVHKGAGVAGLITSILAFLYSWIPAIIWIISLEVAAAA